MFLVSACLVGIPCQYDGGSCPNDQIQALATQGGVLPFCPEMGGGLPTPRPPAEIQGGDGGDVTLLSQFGSSVGGTVDVSGGTAETGGNEGTYDLDGGGP